MLTNEQEQVAEHEIGHAKVLAGAGSGKSHTCVARISNLVNKRHFKPEVILSVMFNRDARDSFEAKLKRTMPTKRFPVFTFHGLGSALLNEMISRNFLQSAKLETNEYNQSKFAEKVLDRWLPPKGRRLVVYEFLSFVDLVKSSLQSPIKTFNEYEISASYRYFIDGFHQFEKARAEKRIRFFSDLIYDPILFLKNNPDKVELFTNRYDHVIVDEFQDINDIQMELIRIVSGERASVMVVGDDDQCIYTWRGAKPSYLINGFDKIFKNPKIFTLSQTFRFGHQVAMGANYLIKNNQVRTEKFSTSSGQSPSTQIVLETEVIGQPSVARHVKQWVAQPGRQYSDIAVLIRAYHHSIQVELSLLSEGIPYRIEGGTPIFSSPDIGAIVTSLHLANRSYQTLDIKQKRLLAMWFIRNPSTGISYDEDQDLLKAIGNDPDNVPDHLNAAVYKTKEKWAKERLQKKAMIWQNLSGYKNRTPREVMEYAYAALEIEKNIKYSVPNVEDQESAFERFRSIEAYADHTEMELSEFVAHVDLLRSATVDKDTATDTVTITSMHRSKGLEWPFVIMPSLVQGKFPHIPKDKPFSLEKLADERRLFYVGITRAVEKLLLIAPSDKRLSKYLNAFSDKCPIMEAGDGVASQFLYEMNIQLAQNANSIMGGDISILRKSASAETAIKYTKFFLERNAGKGKVAAQ